MQKQERMLSFIFIFSGVLAIIVSAFLLPSVLNYEGKIDTVGTITAINHVRSSGDDDSYEVFVSYQVNGVDYESKLNGYSSSYKVGKEIVIYYDEKDPSRIGTKELDMLIILVPFLGGIALVVGIVLFIKTSGKKKLLSKLKETGMIINANYVETRINYHYSMNGRNPYNIICEWFSSEDNKTYQFISENIWDDPMQYITDNNITSFPVYINPQNKKEYVLDYQALLPNIK